MKRVTLREATPDDAVLLFEWRNDAATRENSFNRDEIDLESHRRWFAQKLAARDRTRIWLMMNGGVPVGQVRYERQGDCAEISVSIDPAHRGEGLGTAILRASAPRACRELDVREVRGLVKLTNVGSLVAFERAGFRRAEDTAVSGEPAAVFVWSCAGSQVP